MLAGQLVDEPFERLAIALREHRARALSVIGEHDEAIGPRCVGGGLLDDPDDLVEACDGVARLNAVRSGVVGDLVVVDEVGVDEVLAI